MKYFSSWKYVCTVAGIALAAGVACLAFGATGAATGLFVVACLEIAVGSVLVVLSRTRAANKPQ